MRECYCEIAFNKPATIGRQKQSLLSVFFIHDGSLALAGNVTSNAGIPALLISSIHAWRASETFDKTPILPSWSLWWFQFEAWHILLYSFFRYGYMEWLIQYFTHELLSDNPSYGIWSILFSNHRHSFNQYCHPYSCPFQQPQKFIFNQGFYLIINKKKVNWTRFFRTNPFLEVS